MSSPCDKYRLELDLIGGGQVARSSTLLREHLDHCAACAAFARTLEAIRGRSSLTAPPELDGLVERLFSGAGERRRADRALAALGRLEREAAPAALDGRVVAATQAGHRQDRAVEQVSSLTPLDAPPILDELVVGTDAVQDASGMQAPFGLDERVASELARPEHYVGPRLARDLSPLGAPSELEGRLARHLSSTPRRRALRLVYSASVAAAAAVCLWIGARINEPAPIDVNNLSFDVHRIDSAADLSPMAREIVNGLTGGALERF